MLSGKQPGTCMQYTIEFFRWVGPTPDKAEIIRRHTGDFPDRHAAVQYGLGNTGEPDSPEEADGFEVLENGLSRNMTIIKRRSHNA
jgi:hypothetical protein